MAADTNNIVRIGKLELRFLADMPQLVMFEFVIPPGAQVPVPHYHKDVDEVVYALEGVTTTTLDAQKHDLQPGQSLLVPRGHPHTHENLRDEAATSLIVMTPGTINKRYFEEIAEQVNGAGPPDRAKLKEIMLQYGLIPA